jgi:hypothetical protein
MKTVVNESSSDIMAGVSICCALADPATVWFLPVEHSSSHHMLALACMVYSCCPCAFAADAIVNTGFVLFLRSGSFSCVLFVKCICVKFAF